MKKSKPNKNEEGDNLFLFMLIKVFSCYVLNFYFYSITHIITNFQNLIIINLPE